MTHTTTTTTISTSTTTAGGESATKRQKPNHHDHQPLLQGLPDHIAQLCLSLVHPSLLYSVSRSWRRLIYSPSFPPFLSLYALFLPTDQTHLTNSIEFSSFDPISSTWHSLPPPPPSPPLRPILHHPSFLSRNLPIQSVSVSGNLILLAATTDNFLPALPRPLLFNPISKKWSFGPALAAPRRWCATGACGDKLYVASGIGSHYKADVARTVLKWDLRTNLHPTASITWKWEKLGDLRDGKLSRDAFDAVGWRGKLCLVYSAKQGFVYNIDTDVWEDMPEGMVAGWRGPAAAMEEETLYSVDGSKGVLMKYDAGSDRWEEILGEERLKGAEQIAAAGGRVCVICDGGGIVVVDVVASPARFWVVDTPTGLQAVAVHVLPRMSRSDFEQTGSEE